MVSQPVTFLWPEFSVENPSELPGRLQALARGSRMRMTGRLAQLAAVEAPAELATLLSEELDPGLKVVR